MTWKKIVNHRMSDRTAGKILIGFMVLYFVLAVAAYYMSGGFDKWLQMPKPPSSFVND